MIGRRWAAAITLTGALAGAPAAGAAVPAGFTLSTTTPTENYNPTYLGDGYMAVRVPADGQGFQTSPIATEAHVAGLYEQYLDTTGLAAPPGVTALDVAVPQWTGLSFSSDGDAWSPSSGALLRYRQTLDMYDGLLTTAVRWRSPSGRVTDLRYEVFVDRARMHVGVVRLTVTPRWSGTATVQDVLGPGGAVEVEGSQADPLSTVSSGADPASRSNRFVAATPSGSATVAETSRLITGPIPHMLAAASTGSQLSGLTVSFPVRAGRTYVLAKIVGVASTADPGGDANPASGADGESLRAARLGAAALLAESARAWHALWRSRVDVLGDARLNAEVHASLFYLLESFNAAVPTSTPPGGLSSGGYNGHIFWDADTWMYPAMLAGHPQLARSMNAYREDRLAAAEKYAAATGYSGARFPWESAATGGEEAPPPFGTLEQHISADVALAQWQYYLATGDRAWLAQHGWPVISAVADFWASRVVAGPTGDQILGVMPPDEYDFPVNDSAYTNAGAITALRAAVAAAVVLGKVAPPMWSQVADRIVMPYDPTQHIELDYDDYTGKQIKQADAVMLTYPWEFPLSPEVAVNDLEYYIPRTDPEGPSMTDSIHAIDALALNVPGCSGYTLMRDSLDPFIRPPFDQFSETRSGGTFTFLTGTGGFMQSLLYGFSGLRWRADHIRLDPTLPPQLKGVVERGLRWHGRAFTVSIGPRRTVVTLLAGAPAPVQAPGVARLLTRRRPLVLTTRRPDLLPTSDLGRCKPARASGTAVGYSPADANDGSDVTDWVGAGQTDSLTIDLTKPRTVHAVTITWGLGVPQVNTFNLAGSLSTTSRATSYTIEVSSDARRWRTVASLSNGSGNVDSLSFSPVRTRYVRLSPQATSGGAGASVGELSVAGS